MTGPADDAPGIRRTLRPTERLIDLTNTDPIVDAAQLAVEELQSVLGGGPWCIAVRSTGEVLACTGSLGTNPVRTIPLAAPELELIAIDDGDDGTGEHDPEMVGAAIERIGRLLAAVVDAEHRAAEAASRAEEAEQLATIDALTGLLDQGEWWRRIEELEARLERHPHDVAIVVIDLDGLKTINDTEGHLHGDLLIRLAAGTLSAVVRAGDVVARVGGDEFAVLAIDHGSSAEVLVGRIRAALDAAGIAASVGAGLHMRRSRLRDTYAAADRAMYEDKDRRRRGR